MSQYPAGVKSHTHTSCAINLCSQIDWCFLLRACRLGVVHRDIKPENFLLGSPTLLSAPAGSAASVLKISDFGVSAFYTPGEVC